MSVVSVVAAVAVAVIVYVAPAPVTDDATLRTLMGVILILIVINAGMLEDHLREEREHAEEKRKSRDSSK